ncbi:MAG: FtsK/SpoIIIE domain-containing protein [Kineosporiaceae bacterium]
MTDHHDHRERRGRDDHQGEDEPVDVPRPRPDAEADDPSADPGARVLPFPRREPRPLRTPPTSSGSNPDEESVTVTDEEINDLLDQADDATAPDRGSGGARRRVDGPAPDGPGVLQRWATESRRPILPPWATSPTQARAATRYAAGHLGHTCAYHVVRLPLYALRLAWRAPLGGWRAAGWLSAWLFDTAGHPVRVAAIRAEDAQTYLRLEAARDRRVHARAVIAAVVTVLAAVAVIVAVVAAPPDTLTPAAAAVTVLVTVLLGLAGAPAGRPLIDRAVLPTAVQPLTSDVVVRALSSLGLAEMSRAARDGRDPVTFPAPIQRDGPGWRAEVDLPFGVTVGDVVDRRDKLASGLRRPLGCVWPDAAPDAHAGRLVLWVGDQDMATAKPAAWPLARRTGHGGPGGPGGRGGKPVSLFWPLPFGVDPCGRTVVVSLVESNVLIGAMPGAGKTAALRVLLLGACLDPAAELRLFELKGSGDLSSLSVVAHEYVSGADDDAVEAALTGLRALRREISRRTTVIKGLPRGQAPDFKVTPELAARKSLGLHPLVFAVDECQELFTHPVYGKEAGDLAEKIIKLGRAVGVVLILATQRPDARSLPTGVSDNVGIRFCLRVMGQVANDMILGTSSYKNGIRATTFRPRDKGIGYLVGADDDPQVVRTYYIDGPTAEKITAHARALREAAGTLAGHAAGQATTPGPDPAVRLLEDLLTVVPATEAKVWSETALTRLAAHRPDAYAGWGPEQLAALLKPHGVRTHQVWGTTTNPDGTRGPQANRRGLVRADLAAAYDRARRTTTRPVAVALPEADRGETPDRRDST